MDMPVSIGAGSDRLSLQGCGVVVRPHLPRDNVQEMSVSMGMVIGLEL